ncbi:MAG TPA: hypothetical protein VEB68_04825 [Croceibacterium sp.]|nr:hypothetical protein [Croceibacterium sp.]
MSTRTSSALALLLLAACAPDAPGAPEPGADDDSLIACALAGAGAFERVCGVERRREGEGLVLVVRHPDGGFRRFAVLDDGRGLAAADGAEPAAVAMHGEGIEVAVGADRYRFPARIAGDGAR